MKTLLIITASLSMLLSLCSCSKLIHSHEQVMTSYNTKEEVKKQFGVPDEKKEENYTTEWIYDCDSLSYFSTSKTKATINGTYNTVYGSLDHTTVNVTQFTPYQKYVKFTFDEQGKVLNRDSYGVNFTERKMKPVATIGLVIGSIAAATVFITTLIAMNELANWGN